MDVYREDREEHPDDPAIGKALAEIQKAKADLARFIQREGAAAVF